MVGHHCCFGEPFALSTCSKCDQLFSKRDFIIEDKVRRTSGVNWYAKKLCRAKLLTQPSYQIKKPATLIEVKQDVLVFEYLHNRIKWRLSHTVWKTHVPLQCLYLYSAYVVAVPCIRKTGSRFSYTWKHTMLGISFLSFLFFNTFPTPILLDLISNLKSYADTN